jgi:mRNA interferase MazF
VARFDELIAPSDAEYAQSGLKSASLIRLSFLAVLPERALLGRIGSISPARHRRLLTNLCRHLGV